MLGAVRRRRKKAGPGRTRAVFSSRPGLDISEHAGGSECGASAKGVKPAQSDFTEGVFCREERGAADWARQRAGVFGRVALGEAIRTAYFALWASRRREGTTTKSALPENRKVGAGCAGF